MSLDKIKAGLLQVAQKLKPIPINVDEIGRTILEVDWLTDLSFSVLEVLNA